MNEPELASEVFTFSDAELRAADLRAQGYDTKIVASLYFPSKYIVYASPRVERS